MASLRPTRLTPDVDPAITSSAPPDRLPEGFSVAKCRDRGGRECGKLEVRVLPPQSAASLGFIFLPTSRLGYGGLPLVRRSVVA
mgnify:CR=1 FL=1